MGNWLNNDGLYLQFGPEAATVNTGGEYVTTGEFREVEVDIDLTALTEVEVVQSDTTFIPAGFEIASVQILVETAAATGVAVDVGLVRTDRTTAIDFDGIIAAMATATITDGQMITATKGVTPAGALVGSGSALANVGYITASRTTAAAFTAGRMRVKIQIYRP